MKQAVKATALLLFVSLLSGCSSAEAEACDFAQQSRNSYLKQANQLQAAYLVKTQLKSGDAFDTFLLRIEAQSKAAQYVVNNPACFTPKQLDEALAKLEESKNYLK
jgi:uncharacterized lipoprotein